MDIVLGWSMEEEEKWNANEMYEHADHDLGNVQ